MIDSIFQFHQSGELIDKVVDFLAESQSYLNEFKTQKCTAFDELIDGLLSKGNSDLVAKLALNDSFFDSYIKLIQSHIRYEVDYVKIICNASTLGESSWVWNGVINNALFTKDRCHKICSELYSQSDIEKITAEQISSSIGKYGMNGPLFISLLASSGKLTSSEACHYFELFVHDYVCTVDYTDNYLSENNELNSYCQKISSYLLAYKNDKPFLTSAIRAISQSISELLARDSKSGEAAKVARELNNGKYFAESLLGKENLIKPAPPPPDKLELDCLSSEFSISYENRDALLHAISLKMIDQNDLNVVIEKLMIKPNMFELDLICDILLSDPKSSVINNIAKHFWLETKVIYEPFEATYQKIDELLSATNTISHSIIADIIKLGCMTDIRAKAILCNHSMNDKELVDLIKICNQSLEQNKDLTSSQVHSIKKAQYYAASKLAMGSIYPSVLQGVEVDSELMDQIILIGAEHSKLTRFDLGIIERLMTYSTYAPPISKIARVTATNPDLYEQLIGLNLKAKCNLQEAGLVTRTRSRQL